MGQIDCAGSARRSLLVRVRPTTDKGRHHMPVQGEAPLPLILVAHRARDTVELLRSLLSNEGYSTLSAYNGLTARQSIRRHQPDLLLLENALPLLDGLELCRELRRVGDGPSVFILGDRSDEHSKLLAFAVGADDYLPLPMHPRELLGRTQAVLRRSRSRHDVPGSVVRCGRIVLDPERRDARADGRSVALTSLEYELLSVFAAHPGRVFARDELLARLTKFVRGEPFDRAVDVHISNLRRKLADTLGEQAPIETVRGVGYRLRSDRSGSMAGGAGDARSADLDRLALAALRRAPVPMLVLSAERTVLLYNEAAEHLCGWKSDEVAGQVKCYSLLGCHTEGGALLCRDQCPLHGAQQRGLVEQQAQYVITLKDGRELPVVAHYSDLGDADGLGVATLLVLQPQG
jgi:DNA-binding response OmpR family regulator